MRGPSKTLALARLFEIPRYCEHYWNGTSPDRCTGSISTSIGALSSGGRSSPCAPNIAPSTPPLRPLCAFVLGARHAPNNEVSREPRLTEKYGCQTERVLCNAESEAELRAGASVKRVRNLASKSRRHAILRLNTLPCGVYRDRGAY